MLYAEPPVRQLTSMGTAAHAIQADGPRFTEHGGEGAWQPETARKGFSEEVTFEWS